MVLRVIPFCLLLLKLTAGYDFIRDALNSIDQNADPCDDFYRHACPRGDYGRLSETKYKPIFDELMLKQKDNVWENLEFKKALDDVNLGEINFNLGEINSSEVIIGTFYDLCENNSHLKLKFLQMVQEIAPEPKEEEDANCALMQCLPTLSGDRNCTRAAEILRNNLKYLQTVDIPSWKAHFENILTDIHAVNLIIDGDFREGVRLLRKFVEDEVNILSEWIEKTPWVTNHAVRDALEEVTRSLFVSDNYAVQLRQNIDAAMKLEQNFLKCAAELENQSDIFCLIYTSIYTEYRIDFHSFEIPFQARNRHPKTYFAVPLYAIIQDSEEMAGKLGFIGLISAHEVSHSLIEDPEHQQYLPTFSNEVISCIQDQHYKTCKEFVETSCEVAASQIDDNGADILGLQLAYQMFENHYQERKQDVYVELNQRNVTFQQLFFYAAALTHCSGEPSVGEGTHSADNIRANVVAQHPGFQEAFQCSSDSRMMRTVEKQCVIYGEKAPELRRKKFHRKSSNQQ